MEDDIFQLGELVDPYWVAQSNNIEKNSNFHITETMFVNVDVEELNDVLSYNKHTQVDEDDSDEISIEDCNGVKDESIDEEENNSD